MSNGENPRSIELDFQPGYYSMRMVANCFDPKHGKGGWNATAWTVIEEPIVNPRQFGPTVDKLRKSLTEAHSMNSAGPCIYPELQFDGGTYSPIADPATESISPGQIILESKDNSSSNFGGLLKSGE